MPNSHKILFWLPMAMVGTLVVGGGYLNYQSWSRAETELKTGQRELAILHDSNEAIKRAVLKAGELPKVEAKFDVEAPRDPNMGTILESISGKLSELEIGGEEIVTEPTKTGPKYTREPVTLKFRADGAKTQKVLEHLTRSERIIRIDKLKVEQAQDGGAPVVEIHFSAFSRPAEEATAWLEPR